MKTEISKLGFDPKKRYSGVYQQQGRMITDADWNEWVETVKNQFKEALLDAIGSGTPHERRVSIEWDENSASARIKPGYLYVDGIPAQVSGDANGVEFNAQQDFPNAPLPAPDAIIYADVWERSVVSLEDPDLRDPGLHGADTCSRTQTMAQIKWCPPTVNPETDRAANPPMGNAKASMRLWEDSDADSERADPCITEAAEKPRIGNYLFRLEVHDALYTQENGGTSLKITFKWSSENGAEQHSLRLRDKGGMESYSTEALPPEFGSGAWTYEYYNDDTEKYLGQHLATDYVPVRAVLDSELKSDSGLSAIDLDLVQYVRRWDGFCTLVLSRSANDQPWQMNDLQQGEDKGQALQLRNVAGHGNVLEQEQGGNVQLTIYLENLILTLDLGASEFLAGDFWLAVIRENAAYDPGNGGDAIDERVTTLNEGLPLGVRHHYLILAQIENGTIKPFPAGSPQARRLDFPSLTNLTADSVAYNPQNRAQRWLDIKEVSDLGEPPKPNTVQQAIDDLVQNLESSDITYRLAECASTPYDTANLKRLLEGLIPKTVDAHGRSVVKIQDMWDALLCHLDAAKLPYNPTAQESRWQDINETRGFSQMWSRHYGGTGFQYLRDLTIDSFGNIVLTGYFQDSIN